jgi:hypothetical protein
VVALAAGGRVRYCGRECQKAKIRRSTRVINCKLWLEEKKNVKEENEERNSCMLAVYEWYI